MTYLVLRWAKNKPTDEWKLQSSTVARTIGSAKRIRTMSLRWPLTRVSIIDAVHLELIGDREESGPLVIDRATLLEHRLKRMNVKTMTQ